MTSCAPLLLAPQGITLTMLSNIQQHPNEYIRGATLRFLQKIREPELLEPLIPTCRACLVSAHCPRWVEAAADDVCAISQEHRHSFVRKNAVMAVFTIYKNFEFLIPDAPELIQTFMAAVSFPRSLPGEYGRSPNGWRYRNPTRPRFATPS